jgi:hypothetical protein
MAMAEFLFALFISTVARKQNKTPPQHREDRGGARHVYSGESQRTEVID